MIGRPQLVSDDRMGLRVSFDTPKMGTKLQ
jgi:hypothetical protein